MIFQEWFTDLTPLLTKKHLFNLGSAILFLLIGRFLAKKTRKTIQHLSQIDGQQRLLFSQVGYYSIYGLATAAALSQMGVDLKVLLGAAGVLTVAIGFAAQTSASNLMSGLFLMIEQPFVVGNIIAVGEIRGEVMSIDLLSSKIRTFNNVMVRIPNETLMKSNITNLSYFPIRRIEIKLGVPYSADISRIEQILKQVASDHPLCLDEPAPTFLFNGFGDSAMDVQLMVWTSSENLILLQNNIYRDIKLALDREGIDIPYPTRTVFHIQETSLPHSS